MTSNMKQLKTTDVRRPYEYRDYCRVSLSLSISVVVFARYMNSILAVVFKFCIPFNSRLRLSVQRKADRSACCKSEKSRMHSRSVRLNARCCLIVYGMLLQTQLSVKQFLNRSAEATATRACPFSAPIGLKSVHAKHASPQPPRHQVEAARVQRLATAEAFYVKQAQTARLHLLLAQHNPARLAMFPP
eukprot:6130106-Pleurochrysis_carterae.AAC.6